MRQTHGRAAPTSVTPGQESLIDLVSSNSATRAGRTREANCCVADSEGKSAAQRQFVDSGN
jgi:hypothetical protein